MQRFALDDVVWAEFRQSERRDQVQQIMDHLRQLVNEFGKDYLDPDAECGNTCQYIRTSDDETRERVPSCIVGQVLYRLHCPRLMDVGGQIESNWEILNISQQALLILAVAQSVQDGKGTWGQAVNAASRAAENMPYVV